MTALTRTLEALGLARTSPPDPAPTPPAMVDPQVTAPTRGTSGTVTVTEALAHDAVFRAFAILQTAAEQLTLDVWRNGARIARPSLVARPDLDSHRAGFVAETVTSLAGRGNAFWRKYRGPDGAVVQLRVLDPLTVGVYRDATDHRPRYLVPGVDRPLTGDDVAHLKLIRLPGAVLGLGPVQAAATGLRGHLDVAAFGSGWFRDTETPEGVLSTDAALTPAQASDWADAWREARAKSRTAVLGSGLRYSATKLTPAEAQWLESQRFGVTAIARLWGIPPRQMLASIEGQSMTYANAEQEDISFVRYTLMAYLREIEMAMSDLLPHGQEARFDLGQLLRTDMGARFAAYKVAIDGRFMSVAEVRAIEGLAPGDAPTEAPVTPAPTPLEVPNA